MDLNKPAVDAEIEDFAERLTRLALSLHLEKDIAGALHRIVTVALTEIPGAAHSSVRVAGGDYQVASGDDAAILARHQWDSGVGPGPEALETSTVVRSQNLEVETRWPEFVVAARGHGVRSVASFPMLEETGSIGALTVYATRLDAFPEANDSVGELLAALVTMTVTATQTEGQLLEAVASRDLIGQAKGILMQRYEMDADHAFGLLARVSSTTNLKLREVAAHLVETGELPSQP